MDGNVTEGVSETKDELESKKAQEVIGLLLHKSEDDNEVLKQVSQDVPSSVVNVSVSGTSPLSICHVSLSDAGMLLESGDIIHQSLDGTSIQLEDGSTLIQSYEPVDESDSSDAVTKFIDGQAVQLEDGTTAFIHSAPRVGLQPVQLEDGTMAYLSQTGADLFNGEASTLDLDNLASLQVNENEEKDTDIKISVLEKSWKSAEIFLSNKSGSHVISTKSVEKAFRCPYDGCRRLYTTLHHLKVHERSHTGDRPFKCAISECGKAFATGYGLKSHTRIHTGEAPYKCPEETCNKAFKTSGDLQKHVRTHTGERPFKCPYNGCDRAFTTSNIRKVHIRTHTGERPYVCKEEGCGRAFASATNYKNHIRIHTGEKPYVCTVSGCHKRFTEYSSLYKHHIVHTHSKPYICNLCGKTYRQTSTLAMHKRTAHGIVEQTETESPTPEDEVSEPAVKDEKPKKEPTDVKESKQDTQLKVTNVQDASGGTTTSFPTIVTVPSGSSSQILQERPLYAVQLQEDGTLSSMQQIVLVGHPEQLAAIHQLAEQGQLESVLSVTEQPSAEGS